MFNAFAVNNSIAGHEEGITSRGSVALSFIGNALIQGLINAPDDFK